MLFLPVRIVTTLLLLAVAIPGGAVWLSSAPEQDDIQVKGLSGPVTIAYDRDGIPRITAGSAVDAAAGLGAAHARDRLFQMDLMRRAASGRLSEIAGPRTLFLDRMARTLGLRRRAEDDLAHLPGEVRARLDAYSAGVNAVIAARGRFAAPEFVLFGRPEPWTPVDSLLWGKTMALWLSGNWRTELARVGLAGRLTPGAIRELWPGSEPAAATDALLLPGLPDAARRLADALPAFPAPFTMPSTASNEWAVDGRHSASGAPLLAGDPHLQFGLPGIWYLARLQFPGGVFAGATSPGVPFMIIGHNGKVAWTFTTTGADTQDVFVETVQPDGQYLTPDGPRPFATREERIRVRGGEDQVLHVRETRHGPVVDGPAPPSAGGSSAGSGGGASGQVMAVAMTALLPGDTSAAGLAALNDAADVAAVGRAAAFIAAPVQNLLAADRERIGFFTTGRVPIRRAGDGSEPVNGADGAHDWLAIASGDQLAHVISPPSGRLVNANEPVRMGATSVFMGVDAFGDWRARRIRTLLLGASKHTALSFAAMQVDATSEFARDVLPTLRGAGAPEGVAARAKALLDHWSGEMATDLPQPLILYAWLRQFETDVLNRAGVSSIGPWTEFVRHVLSPAGGHWCGAGNGGGASPCAAMLRDALGTVSAALAQRFGSDPASWRWGDAHRAVFAHPLLGGLFAARIEQPGDDTTVYRGTARAGTFESIHGAGLRAVFDLADLDGASLFVVTPGQAGNPFSPLARRMVERWRDGSTVALGPLTGPPSAELRLAP